MKKRLYDSLLAVVLTLPIVSAIGCQSGWKFNNPFSREPRASAAKTPRELEELDELDGLTPPPENYTKQDEEQSSKSLVQKGKYSDGSESKSEKKASEDLTKASASKESSVAKNEASSSSERSLSETVKTETNVASLSSGTSATYQSSSQPTSSEHSSFSPSTSSYASDSFGGAGSEATIATSVPSQSQSVGSSLASDQNTFASQTYSTTPSDSPFPTADESNAFPTTSSDLTPFPEAETNGFTAPPTTFADASSNNQVPGFNTMETTGAAANGQTIGEPTKVAMDYDPYATQTSASSNSTVQDTDPYSNIYYSPQTASGGFAPGSTAVY